MFGKILCPVDLESHSAVALETARKLAEQNHATVSLVHVVSPPLPGPLERVPDWERTVNYRLGRLAKRFFGDQIRWDTIVLRGDPANAIIQAADDLAGDVIVMATHGHKGINRLLLGSVAEHVVRKSPIPVLTVRPNRPKRSPSRFRRRPKRSPDTGVPET
jgi:nucleotide-binding universal stress UspA family protein